MLNEIPQTWTWKWFWVFVLCCRTYRCCRKCNFKCDSSVQERETLCGSTKLVACLSAIVMPLRTALHKAAENHTLLQTGSSSPCSGTNATNSELPTSYSMQTSPLLDCNTTISCLPCALNSQGGLTPWFNPTQNSTVTTANPVSIQHCRPKNVGHRRVYMNWWLLNSAWSLQSYLRFPVHSRGCRKFCKPPPPHTSFQTIWRTWTADEPSWFIHAHNPKNSELIFFASKLTTFSRQLLGRQWERYCARKQTNRQNILR